jgi:hypothetical protein
LRPGKATERDDRSAQMIAPPRYNGSVDGKWNTKGLSVFKDSKLARAGLRLPVRQVFLSLTVG